MNSTMQNVSNKVAKTIHTGANKGKDVMNTIADEADKVQLQSTVNSGIEHAQDLYESGLDQAQEALKAAEDFVKKYPVQSALGVAAIGILAGYLIFRNSR